MFLSRKTRGYISSILLFLLSVCLCPCLCLLTLLPSTSPWTSKCQSRALPEIFSREKRTILTQWNLPERPPLLSDHQIGSSVSQIAISETSRKRPPLLSDHLTKIPIGSSVSQIAISETSRTRPPLLSDHLTKIPISSSVSQIAISETSCKRPPKPDMKGGHLWEVPLYARNTLNTYLTSYVIQ